MTPPLNNKNQSLALAAIAAFSVYFCMYAFRKPFTAATFEHEAGVNAGCWSIGITRTGNLLGLSQEEVDNLPVDELENRIAGIGKQCLQAGAHKVIPSVTELEHVLLELDEAIENGESPLHYSF